MADLVWIIGQSYGHRYPARDLVRIAHLAPVPVHRLRPMKWKRGKGDSRDVIDIRGARDGRSGGRGSGMGSMGGLGSGMQIPGGGKGLGGGAGAVVVLVVLAIAIFSGGGENGGGFDIGSVLNGAGQAPGAVNPQPLPAGQDPDRDLRDFSAYVFSDTQETWRKIFAESGERYDPAKVVLYAGAVSTGGCGNATSAVGPFYCPADQRVYLDLSFYRQMQEELGAGGDFAWAYVIAHEMGHHVQRETGISEQVQRERQSNPSESNQLSVRLELQADCYAGVWASTVFDQLEPGDLEEAFNASEAVGDDRLQSRGGGRVNPDSFTHGTSEHRRRWFTRGYESGDPDSFDTFIADV